MSNNQKDLRSDASSRDLQPSYAGLFRCTGPHCEDTCCGDWDIPVDKITYQEYRRFPAEKLGSPLRNSCRSALTRATTIFMAITLQQDGSCPFLGADSTMREIQKEYGPSQLTSTCSIYPRVAECCESKGFSGRSGSFLSRSSPRHFAARRFNRPGRKPVLRRIPDRQPLRCQATRCIWSSRLFPCAP